MSLHACRIHPGHQLRLPNPVQAGVWILSYWLTYMFTTYYMPSIGIKEVPKMTHSSQRREIKVGSLHYSRVHEGPGTHINVSYVSKWPPLRSMCLQSNQEDQANPYSKAELWARVWEVPWKETRFPPGDIGSGWDGQEALWGGTVGVHLHWAPLGKTGKTEPEQKWEGILEKGREVNRLCSRVSEGPT